MLYPYVVSAFACCGAPTVLLTRCHGASTDRRQVRFSLVSDDNWMTVYCSQGRMTPLCGTLAFASSRLAAVTQIQHQSRSTAFGRSFCELCVDLWATVAMTLVAVQVCDIDPLSWEDRDIIRLEIKQLCDSFDSVCQSLRTTDDMLVSGKKCCCLLLCSHLTAHSAGWSRSRFARWPPASRRCETSWT